MIYKPKRIGVYSGTFDPVHAGHIAFALQALTAARLDMVYFMPERSPRRKTAVEHYAHRYAMLRRAVRPHHQLAVLDTVDKQFSVRRTLPWLQQQFPGVKLVFLCGSDVIPYLSQWAHVEALLRQAEFCVGLRQGSDSSVIKRVLHKLGLPSSQYVIIESYDASISSTQIRESLRRKRPVRGLLASVHRYAEREWLYL